MAANYDLSLNRNESFNLYLDYLDEAGNPIDLATHECKMLVKLYRTAPTGSVLFTSTPYGVSCGSTGSPGPTGGIKLNRNSDDTGGQTGGILITANPFVTMTLSSGKSFYDIFLIDANDVSTKLLEGAMNITQEVTRDDISIVSNNTDGGWFI